MTNIISVNNLSKSYADVEAVHDISFSIEQGEMFGLVGPDGAGKTTTIRILCGLLSFKDGSVSLFDKDIHQEKKAIQNQIGYLSQKFSLYGDLSVDENIEFFAEIHGVKEYQARRDELLTFTRLLPFRKRTADNLSGGMKQKLALACSLIHKPKILFLDEPTTGVDPVSRRDFWKILSSLLKEGITIFMSTPYLDEAERCNRVGLMHNGKIINLDTPQNLKASIEMEVIEIICSDIQTASKLIKTEFNLETQLFGDRINIMVDKNQNAFSEIETLLNSKGISIHDHRILSPSLENVFIHLVEEQK
ncbi:MAG: ABC transporter ATP-binding protein [Ignavibacteriaceae bacterium]|jgi:ABC-2 type transport system ATP-binding protein